MGTNQTRACNQNPHPASDEIQELFNVQSSMFKVLSGLALYRQPEKIVSCLLLKNLLKKMVLYCSSTITLSHPSTRARPTADFKNWIAT
jgi:hypothetical protein